MEFFAKDMDKNAILCYNEKKEKKKEAKKMFVRDGNLLDTTDWESDRFLQINSAGEQCGLSDYTCLRRRGRRDWLLLLITAGRCEVEYGEKCYSLQAGDFVVYPPHTPQRYAFFEQASSCFCHFSGNAASALLADCALTGGVYRHAHLHAAHRAFLELIERFHAPHRSRYATATLLELLYRLSEHGQRTSAPQREQERAISTVLSYLRANYQKEIPLGELAAMAGYSKSRFSHLFAAVTQTTPRRYQNALRLQASCEFLESTTLSVGEIAYACGFADPLYYSRLFLQRYGVSPTAYRRQISDLE